MSLVVAGTGGGFAGLSAAVALARRLKARVRLLEARPSAVDTPSNEHVGLWSPALGVLSSLGVLDRLAPSELQFLADSSYRTVQGRTLAKPATPLRPWAEGMA